MKFYKLQRKFAILCLISILLIVPPTQAYAYTVKECKEALVHYSLDFVEKKAKDTHYYNSDYQDNLGSERAKAYMRDEYCKNSGHVEGMGMDCVGWVSYAIHHCYGIGPEDRFYTFVSPMKYGGADGDFFENHSGTAGMEAGDIIITNGHVEIYVGDGKIVDCVGGSNQGQAGTGVRLANEFDTIAYAVLTEKGASQITTLIDTYNGTGLTNSSGTSINYSKFFFNGIPDGTYSLASRQNIFQLLINAIKELMNFLTGLLTYLFRGLIIGIISIFDRFINNTVQSVSDAPKSIEETGVTATSADDPYSMDRAVTIEGLVFNDIDLFDINIFKVD